MSTSAISHPTASSSAVSRILTAGLLTAITDGCFSSVLAAFFYGSTVARLWRGVASTLLGSSALQGGATSVAIGIAMHFGVALSWSAVFVLLVSRLGFVEQMLASPGGAVKVAL